MGIRSLCVYCGSRAGNDPVFDEAAAALGRTLAEAGVRLVYGGGSLGLMGRTAGAARDAGGEVFGVIPSFLVAVEGILEGVKHREVETMHERKMLMFEESDAFCVLPGGIGTLEEIIELTSWTRLDLHRKPLVLCNVQGYWNPLIALLEHTVENGFADPALRRDFLVVDSVEDVLPAVEGASLRHRA